MRYLCDKKLAFGGEMRSLLLALFIVFAVGCNYFISTEQIAKDVKEQIQQEFDTQSQFKDYHFKINNLTVIKQQGNQYKGLAEVLYEGQVHRIAVNILMDGEKYIWEIPAENFNFVRNIELEKYQKELDDRLNSIQLEAEDHLSYSRETEGADAKADGADATYYSEEDVQSAAEEAVEAAAMAEEETVYESQ